MERSPKTGSGAAAVARRSVEPVSRELGVEIYRLEKWRDKGLSGIDAGQGDPVQAGLDAKGSGP
jgi:hypothetical protein